METFCSHVRLCWSSWMEVCVPLIMTRGNRERHDEQQSGARVANTFSKIVDGAPLGDSCWLNRSILGCMLQKIWKGLKYTEKQSLLKIMGAARVHVESFCS